MPADHPRPNHSRPSHSRPNHPRLSTPIRNPHTLPLRSATGIGLSLLACLLLSGCGDGRNPEQLAAENREKEAALAQYGSYDKARSFLAESRQSLSKRFREAEDDARRSEILTVARSTFLAETCGGLVPFWYGTAWDFNGTSETPGKGMIACGYFVSTVLDHAGVQVSRIRLAQQASEHIIQSLVHEDHIRRFSGIDLDLFLDAVREEGHGLFIIGLDKHVGFLHYNEEGLFFIHSTAAGTRCVIKEIASESATLRRSRYRVLGSISHSDKFLSKWLRQERFAIAMGGQ